MANMPMMISARARLAMYMLVTVLSLLKMMTYMTRQLPVTAMTEVVTYRTMKNTVRLRRSCRKHFENHRLLQTRGSVKVKKKAIYTMPDWKLKKRITITEKYYF